MRTPTLCTLPLLVVAACGDNWAGPPTDDDAAPAGRTLTGSQVVDFRQVDRTLLDHEVIDLWDAVIEAQVPDGDGWRVRPGTGHRDGSFAIPDVPDGHVWLRVARRPFGETFYWTDAEHVSFDEDIVGGRDSASADDGDQLLLAIDGLADWRDDDELAWFVPDDDVFSMNLVASAPPAPATTDLAGLAIDWSWRALANVDAGDPAYVVQYRTQQLGGVDVRAPIRAAQPTFHQVAGTDGTLATTLTEPPTLRYRLAFARDAFEAQRTAIHPTRAGASFLHGFALMALPGAATGELWLAPEYPLAMLVDPALLEGTTPLDLGELAIPNPFPRSWVADLYVVTFPVDFPMPDGTPMTLEAVIGRRSTQLTASGPATPAITPIRAPQIAGRDAFGALDSVGTTPVVSWTAPAVGTATSYKLTVIEAVTHPPEPYRPGWYIAAELIVPGDVTSIRVPADVLRDGATYGVIVRAFAAPGQDVRTAPHRQRAEAGFADAVLGPFTPGGR